MSRTIDGRELRASCFVAPDYLAIGSDDDYFLAPISPGTAQGIADEIDCLLPTRRMVEAIYAAAPVKLKPAPLPPSAAMVTVPVFLQHNESVRHQRAERLTQFPLGTLVAGHKKDVVISTRLAGSSGKVAIFGWHKPDGQPIQPLYLGHDESWTDYSHGVRLVQRRVLINGAATTAEAVLADPRLSGLLSDEGPLHRTRYQPLVPPSRAGTNRFQEREVTLHFHPEVRVVVNSPAAPAPHKPVRLVLFALPNGNTIEQTIGRRFEPGDDWQFNIQHIGAQTRWLRERMPESSLVVAYLECTGKSWPAWRAKHDPDGQRSVGMVAELRRQFGGLKPELVLTGHSGGGSFTFSFLNGLEQIPDDIGRIAFLDSNYAYDAARSHHTKLARWLNASTNHFLCVLAYHDRIALLNGKTFVSENGGTWGRSQAMLADLGTLFPFARDADAQWQRHTALGGRVKFFLKENPTKAVLHTVQVERNGFIHALVTGTPAENRGYAYFGPRVYEPWIAPE